MQPKTKEKGDTMKTYTAYFYTEADWAKTTIKADTPVLALQRAQQIESDETETLDFQHYDSTGGVEHIEIRSADGGTVAEWQGEDLRLRLAAPELLEALELCLDCLSDLARLDDGTPSISALNQARAAIAKAKGGQP
jgi:hypothetical protein